MHCYFGDTIWSVCGPENYDIAAKEHIRKNVKKLRIVKSHATRLGMANLPNPLVSTTTNTRTPISTPSLWADVRVAILLVQSLQ